MKIKLLHLYYDIMNLYGEYGNIKILEQHLKDQGIDVEVDKKTINEEKDFTQYDFIYIGSGTEKNQKVILEDIKKYKDNFKDYIESNRMVLLTGNSYEILGESIDDVKALNFLNFKTQIINKRNTSDAIYKTDMLDTKLVGFINNMSSITNNEVPLFDVEFGVGENPESLKEGIHYKNIYGTHLIGPLLVRNPDFLKLIIAKLCKSKDQNFTLKDIEYVDESNGYNLVLSELEARSSSK